MSLSGTRRQAQSRFIVIVIVIVIVVCLVKFTGPLCCSDNRRPLRELRHQTLQPGQYLPSVIEQLADRLRRTPMDGGQPLPSLSQDNRKAAGFPFYPAQAAIRLIEDSRELPH
jgi:hypothetical protein